MDENPAISTKKKGRPKGRKDGPRREGAPKRGRPKKRVNNSGNDIMMDIHGDGMDGACKFIFISSFIVLV